MRTETMRYYFLIIFTAAVLGGCNFSSGVERIQNPAQNQSSLPWLYTDNGGNVLLSWVEEAETEADSVLLKYSVYAGGEWVTPETISGSSSWFVNWADYPSIVAFRGDPIAAHWLRKIPGNTYSYVVNISLHTEGNWQPALTPHNDRTATEHGFVSMIPWQENNVLAIWLDGRRTENRPEEEYYNIDKAMTLRSAEISSDGTVTHRSLIDSSVCDCCQTSLVRTSYGAIAAYRNRTAEEIRDIYISRYENGTWSRPFPIHDDGWKIGACPVNGPRLAINDSNIALAWYTRAGDSPEVKLAVSHDEGRNFSSPVTISGDNPLGRVDAVVDSAGTTHVSWMEQSGDSTLLKVKTIEDIQSPEGSAITVTRMDDSRSSGFPQLTAYGNRLMVAWTVTGDDKEIRTAIITPR